MSFLAAFRKPKRELTSQPTENMDIKTLDQALGVIEAQNAQIQGLQNTVTERDATITSLHSDFQTCMEGFGITKTTSDGVVNWQSSQIEELNSSVTRLTAERDELQTKLTAAGTRISELETDQRTVSARAREFLAAQGGKALPVSGNTAPKPTSKQQLMDAMDDARRAGNQDEMARLYAEFKKLPK